ncbi:MAG TPA: LCP family protein [Patescibacteria group bacterium]|nr:LCP family protein [Patescibacteria group bacterium]
MTSRNSRPDSSSGSRLPLWVLGILAAIVLAFLIISSIWLFRTVLGLASDLDLPNPDFGQIDEPAEGSSAGTNSSADETEPDSESIFSSPLPQKWSGHDRVTILVLGIDQRCEEDGPTRTDTMMLLTMDPVGLSAAALSLPRDLWVEIPGFGVDKINQAHFLGEVYEYPGGGPALAVETVEATLGVDIDYYATVNFDAFVKLVDEIEGIEVEVTEDIDDNTYPDNCYGYDPFYINAGVHQLNGQSALKYARTRATFGGDVDRAMRQQQVVMAVRDKILRIDMIPQLLTRAPELWRIFQDNVETDMRLNEVIELALLAQDIPGENIRTEVLNYDYVYNELTPDGQAVLIPVRDKIRVLRDQLFAPPAIPTPVIENLPQLTAAEGARVAIYNGTPFFGLAGETQTFLAEYNINIVEIGNAESSEYNSTQIIDYGSHRSTTLYLTQIMQIPPLNISSSNQPPGDFDVLIILGNDWEVPGVEE